MKRDLLALYLLVAATTTACGSTGSVIGKTNDSQAVGHYAVPKGMLELKYPKAALTDASALTPADVSLHTKSIGLELIPAAYFPRCSP